MLNSLLGLMPLTKVEVADSKAIRESRIGHVGTVIELPYWYFQHVNTDGLLVVSTPGGCRLNIDAMDVMNILPSEPIRVMAMPQAVFLERMKIRYPERNIAPHRNCYFPASVMAAHRDRWGNFVYNVWFDDSKFNTSSTFTAPLMDGERHRLKPLTKRCNMPVSSMTTAANWSEDSQVKREMRRHSKNAKLFITASLKGNTRVTSKMACIDAI